MIGVDTNVLLRVFINDDARQFELARGFFAQRSRENPAFIPSIVLAELAWVLADSYGYSHAKVVDALEVLLESSDFVIEHAGVLEAAISQARSARIDVADALIAGIAAEAGADHTATFDRNASRRIPRMSLLK